MLEVGNNLTVNQGRAHFTIWAMMAAPLILGERLPGGRLAGAGVILVCSVLESLLRGRRAGDSLRAGKCS